MRYLLAVCLLVPAVASAAPVPKAAGKGTWVGKLAFLKTADVKPTTVQAKGRRDLVVPSLAASPTPCYMVTKAGDDQVEVYVAYGPVLHTYRREDVLRAKDAIEFYTGKLASDAKDAFYLTARAAAYLEEEQFDRADADHTKLVELDATNAVRRISRAEARVKAKKFDAALQDYDELIKTNPGYEYYKQQRANTLAAAGKGDQAVAELTKLLDGTPNRMGVLITRAHILAQAGHQQKALDDYDEVLKTNLQSAVAWNNKAWFRCTCPDEKLRDGKEAVELATKACEMTQWQNAGYLDTLAAAYAEQGDFEKAVKWQTQAAEDLDLVRREGTDMKDRLELYKQKKPYRLPQIVQKK